MIRLRYSSLDGVNALKVYKRLQDAREFAQLMVGKRPDFGVGYAVSFDGIGKIEVYGDTKLTDLFGEELQSENG